MRYRLKPTNVTAVQITDEWFDGDHPNPLHPPGVVMDPATRRVSFDSPSGVVDGGVGDWITTCGGFSTCIPDALFAATHDPIGNITEMTEATADFFDDVAAKILAGLLGQVDAAIAMTVDSITSPPRLGKGVHRLDQTGVEYVLTNSLQQIQRGEEATPAGIVVTRH